MSSTNDLSAESFPLENALNAFLADADIANKKVQKARQNLLYRRKLELRMEERKLQKEICEFDFAARR